MTFEVLKIDEMSLDKLIENKAKLIEESDGEITELFEHLDLVLQGKIDKTAMYVKDVIPSHIAACKEQLERLNKLQERIKSYVMAIMQKNNVIRMDGLTHRARIQNNADKVVIVNQELIPAMYKQYKLEITAPTKEIAEIVMATQGLTFSKCEEEVKKKDIGESIKAGIDVKGAELEKGCHIRFEVGAKAKKVE